MSKRTNTKPKPFCFVLMPFDSSFSDIYEFGIKGACGDAGLYCERVDEQVFLGSMLERIFSQIARADILVADMSGKNPNVFYEVGYAHALGKNVILLTQTAADIPFDLKHFPHLVYDNEIKKLRATLAPKLEYLIAEQPSQVETHQGLELFFKNEPLSNGDVIAEYPVSSIPVAGLTLVNNSTRTYQPGDFRISVVAPAPFSSSRMEGVVVTELPDGDFLHTMREFGTLFPGAATRVGFSLSSNADSASWPLEFLVTVRIFSASGLRDFPLVLRRADKADRSSEL